MRYPAVLSLALVGVLAIGACADADAPLAPEFRSSLPASGQRGITAMTHNLYLGGDIDPVATAIATYFATDATPTPEEFAAFIAPTVSQAWLAVLATNFAARTEALADEIARSRPALVGLQEVTTYSLLSLTNPGAGALVQYDFLALLMSALEARGLDYHAVVQSSLTDFQLFAVVPDPTQAFQPGPALLRYHDSDAILARGGVATSDET